MRGQHTPPSASVSRRGGPTPPTPASRSQAGLPAPAACLLPPSLSLFQNANLAPCGADPDASWGTRGTRSRDPCGLWLGQGALTRSHRAHSETPPPQGRLAEGSKQHRGAHRQPLPVEKQCTPVLTLPEVLPPSRQHLS